MTTLNEYKQMPADMLRAERDLYVGRGLKLPVALRRVLVARGERAPADPPGAK